jgi:type VI secretion system protein ImpE
MNPQDLFKAGKLNEAINALGVELRRDPVNLKGRTFLFELLCFSGDYDRAEKHLDVLSQAGPQSEMGVVLYRGLLNATRTRQEVYLKAKPQKPTPDKFTGATGGTLNGLPFEGIVDSDPRMGANLEVLAAGAYLKIPFSFLSSIEIGPPRRLRDTLWIPATIRTTAAFRDRELGEAFLPALTPFAAKHPSDEVRLGRETVWEESEDGEMCPIGQKLLLVDGEEMPILELRKLEFASALAAS